LYPVFDCIRSCEHVQKSATFVSENRQLFKRKQVWVISTAVEVAGTLGTPHTLLRTPMADTVEVVGAEVGAVEEVVDMVATEETVVEEVVTEEDAMTVAEVDMGADVVEEGVGVMVETAEEDVVVAEDMVETEEGEAAAEVVSAPAATRFRLRTRFSCRVCLGTQQKTTSASSSAPSGSSRWTGRLTSRRSSSTLTETLASPRVRPP